MAKAPESYGKAQPGTPRKAGRGCVHPAGQCKARGWHVGASPARIAAALGAEREKRRAGAPRGPLEGSGRHGGNACPRVALTDPHL